MRIASCLPIREPEQPVRGPSVPKTMGDGGTAAAARVGGKQSGATPEEFLNRVAIQRQAARRLLEKADDMTGGVAPDEFLKYCMPLLHIVQTQKRMNVFPIFV